MRAIVIGAGRGARLQYLTADVPKPLVSIVGKPMLEHVLDALAEGGFARKDVVFICGYKREVIRERYPELTYVVNEDWANNNILASLLHAREFMTDGFVSTYADIVYRPKAVVDLVASTADLSLVCDTDWRRRYVGRTQHPQTDAEKVIAKDGLVTAISRTLAPDEATGEFIGVMKASKAGAERFLANHDAARARHGDEVWRGRPFGKAYLIDLLAEMLDQGEKMSEVPTPGGYMEIDTVEDAGLSETWWKAGT